MNKRNHALTLSFIMVLTLALAFCPVLLERTAQARVPGEEPSSGTAVQDARLTQALVAGGKGIVTQHYGFSPLRGWQGHILIAAAEGTEILAPRPGTVAFVGQLGPDSGYARAPLGYGLALRHEGGLVSIYAHCGQVLVEEGREIEAGSALALVGQPGEKQGPFFLFCLQDEENAPLPPELLLCE